MIIFSIIGALIGAGFASGQEMYLFFYRFGIYGILGLLLCSFLIGIVIYKTFLIIYNENISNYQDWNSQDLLKLISTDPKFSEVDMKELFWVSRDNLVDEMSGLSLISTRVKSLFNNAYYASSDTIREDVCKKEIKGLASNELEEVYDLLDSKLLMTAEDRNAFSVYYFCIMNDVERAYQRLLELLSRISVSSIPFSLGNKFKEILEKFGNDKKLKELLKPNGRLIRTIEGNNGKQKQ